MAPENLALIGIVLNIKKKYADGYVTIEERQRVK